MAASSGSTVLYASVAAKLTAYDLDVEAASLTERGSVTLPANVQYAWPHPSRHYFYVVSSEGGPGIPSDRNFAHAFHLEPSTGALTPHGTPRNLPSRPIHASVDMAGEYLLTAYNDPSALTVHRIKSDGSLGEEVTQPDDLDTGKYAHQIRATPDNAQVFMVTRGNNASHDLPVNPGSIKTYGFKDGVLTDLAAIQPGDGMRFGPRHLDFHPSAPWVYVCVESQNKLYVYARDGASGLSREPLFIKETLADPKLPAPQAAGAIHVHPDGRFVYLTNRASETLDVEGRKIFAGGENSIAVFAIDQATGEPTLIQNIDGRGIELRTFAIDPEGRVLVAASIRPLAVREAGTIRTLTAGLCVYRVASDGKLEFARKYDVDVGGKTQFWSGMVNL
jgi:6-phosphogluconolactonase